MTALTSQRMHASALFRDNPVIAVLRARAADDYDRVVDVLAENGVRSIELTLSTPGTFEYLPRLLSRADPGIQIGVGTIVNVEQARRAIDAGAQYLVTPVMDLDVVAFALRSAVPVFPGGLTPTELHAGWAAGATAVKIFPAQSVGPQYGRHLRGPFPELEFVPSGGLALDDVSAWLQGGAAAVSLGSPLLGDALEGGSLDALADRARRVSALAADARRAR